jgi:hypothetical protein
VLHAGKETELHDLGFLRVFLREQVERLVHLQHFFIRRR